MAKSKVNKSKPTKENKDKKIKNTPKKPKVLQPTSLFQSFQHKFDFQQEIFDLNHPKDASTRASALTMVIFLYSHLN